MAVWFHSDKYPSLKISHKRFIKSHIHSIIESYGKKTGDINFIFYTDDDLLNMNKSFLNHHYYTDVITFNYNNGNKISGDIFISVDRIAENAISHKQEFNTECLRVLIHGILHLLGMNDSTNEERAAMRAEEDHLLKNVKGPLIFSK